MSQFLLGIYLVALFSQAFHFHDALEFSKDHSKTQKIDVAKQNSSHEDCLACHFLATGHSLVPDEFSFHIQKNTQEDEQILSVQEKIWSQTKYSFQLRGPPSLV